VSLENVAYANSALIDMALPQENAGKGVQMLHHRYPRRCLDLSFDAFPQLVKRFQIFLFFPLF
jgi:hypothetical protein